jgi:hypothetical protein
MKQRCRLKTCAKYLLYGGRGITYHNEWEQFESFLKDMGEKPEKGWCIHRIDNDGNYTPDNCEWISLSDHMKLHHEGRTP